MHAKTGFVELHMLSESAKKQAQLSNFHFA